MRRARLSRRTFLRSAGGLAIALPFLEIMDGRSARGGPSTVPKRFVVFFSSNGTIPSAWTPTGTGTSFTLGPILAPLEPFKSKLLIPSGINNETAAHQDGNAHSLGIAHMLTATDMIVEGNNGFGNIGHAGGISIDQEIANHVGATTKFLSLEFGVRVNVADTYITHMCYTGPNQPLSAEDDPQSAFNRVFAELGVDPTDLKKAHAQRKSVLDFVADDLNALTPRLGSADRQKLDAYLTAVRGIEKHIDATAEVGASCKKPDMGSLPGDVLSNDAFPAIGQVQMDLLAMSLVCDLTRVASLQWSTAQSGVVHNWLGCGEDHHGLSHEGDSNTSAKQHLIDINHWYAKQLAYLASSLDAIPEGDGTLLDSTIILWASEVGIGNTHSFVDGMPYVLVGGGGGALKTGRHVHFDGARHGELYLTLLHAMDIPADSFGDPKYCSGPLTELLA